MRKEHGLHGSSHLFFSQHDPLQNVCYFTITRLVALCSLVASIKSERYCALLFEFSGIIFLHLAWQWQTGKVPWAEQLLVLCWQWRSEACSYSTRETEMERQLWEAYRRPSSVWLRTESSAEHSSMPLSFVPDLSRGDCNKSCSLPNLAIPDKSLNSSFPHSSVAGLMPRENSGLRLWSNNFFFFL